MKRLNDGNVVEKTKKSLNYKGYLFNTRKHF